MRRQDEAQAPAAGEDRGGPQDRLGQRREDRRRHSLLAGRPGGDLRADGEERGQTLSRRQRRQRADRQDRQGSSRSFRQEVTDEVNLSTAQLPRKPGGADGKDDE